MRRSLTLDTRPESEPITLQEAKGFARIDTEDDDTLITLLISSVRTSAEEYLRRSLISQTWKLTLDLCGNGLNDALGEGVYDMPSSALYGAPGSVIELPKGPVQSVTSVTTYATDNSGSVFDSSNYTLDTAGARLVLNSGCVWPSNLRPIAAIEIEYLAGYGDKAADVPQQIRTGMLIHFAALYEQRGLCADAMDIPPGAKQLYNQHRIMGSRRG